MKIKLFAVLLLLILLLSCHQKGRKSLLVKDSIDLSTIGSINSVKFFNNKVYLLDATNSAIYNLEKGKLQLIVDVNIRGRDFLQDFVLSDSLYYLANTYDSVYTVTSSGKIKEVSFVKSPDKIVSMGTDLYLTKRISDLNEGVCLTKIKVGDKDNIAGFNIDELEKRDKVISDNLIYSDNNKIYLLSNLNKAIYEITRKGKIRRFDFPQDGEVYSRFGKFYIDAKKRKGSVLAEKNNNYWFVSFKIDGENIVFRDKYAINKEIDIQVSAINDGRLYLYDYLNSRLEILELP